MLVSAAVRVLRLFRTPARAVVFHLTLSTRGRAMDDKDRAKNVAAILRHIYCDTPGLQQFLSIAKELNGVDKFTRELAWELIHAVVVHGAEDTCE